MRLLRPSIWGQWHTQFHFNFCPQLISAFSSTSIKRTCSQRLLDNQGASPWLLALIAVFLRVLDESGSGVLERLSDFIHDRNFALGST